MRLAVPKEIVPGEKRVALVPEVIPQLLKMGHTVTVESGAGARAGFTDDAYSTAGATIAPDARATWSSGDVILKVLRPVDDGGGSEIENLSSGLVLVGLLNPAGDPVFFRHAAAHVTT